MTIATYSELQTAIADWLHRPNQSAASLQNFIAIFESRANRRLRLRVMESNESVTASIGSRTIAIPSGYIEPLGFWRTDVNPRQKLTFKLPDALTVSTSNGSPSYWTIDGTNIAFECPASTAFTATFRMLKSFALSDSTTTNWLLTNHPDLYLYGSLVAAAPFVREKEMLPIWHDLVEEAFTEIENKEARSRSLAQLETDLPGVGCGSNILTGD